MKKIVVFLTAILLMMLVGCSDAAEEQTSISIDKNGKVSQRIIESFDQTYYNFEEFQTLVTETVAGYNNSQDGEKIVIKECKYNEKQSLVILNLSYASCLDYKAFNQRELYNGTLESAKETYDFNDKFLDTTGKECDIQQVLAAEPSAKVIVLQEPIAVDTLSEIRYVSGNVEILGETRAKVKSDSELDPDSADSLIKGYAYIIYSDGKG